MARRSTNKAKVNFKGVETRSTPPEGDYLLRVAEAKKGKSSSNNEQSEFIFEIKKPTENKGNKLYLYCPHIDNSLWKLASVLAALGVDVPDDEMEIDYDDLIDREMMGVVHHETYNGKKQARLGDWAPADEYKGADDEDDGKKKKKKDKKAKDEPEEKSSKKDKGKKDKKSKDEPEEKASKKDKGKKDKKPKVEPIYESDEISDMSAKKLQKVIDKHELDVDLDDYKTDRKKAGAVIDALEGAGLLKE